MAPQPGDVVVLTFWTGNQPPRHHDETVTVLEIGDRHTKVRGANGRDRLVHTRWLTRTARRPLDPTPPGPPASGEQTDIFRPPGDPMNAPPPKDMNDGDTRSTADIEAQIAQDAEHARRAVARQYPDEPDTGKTTWDQLGIGKNR